MYEHKSQSREVLQSPARRSFFTNVSVPFKRIYVFLEPIVFALFLVTEILKSFFIRTRIASSYFVLVYRYFIAKNQSFPPCLTNFLVDVGFPYNLLRMKVTVLRVHKSIIKMSLSN